MNSTKSLNNAYVLIMSGLCKAKTLVGIRGSVAWETLVFVPL